MAVELKNVTVMETVENSFSPLSWTPLEEELRAYAKEHQVPIIVDEGLAFLERIIRISQPKTILEIGTAIGYSAIRMQKVCDSQIITIERNPEMIEQARKTIVAAKKESKITLIEADALEAFDLVKNYTFDFIFIDAAKAQYTKFFEMYTPLLSFTGIVVTDNMSFHGLIHQENLMEQSRSVRGLVRKLASYHKYLLEHQEFDTSIIEIGDGIALSVRKG